MWMCRFCKDYEGIKKSNEIREQNNKNITTSIGIGLRNYIFVDGYGSGGVMIENYFKPIYCPLCGKRLEEEKENSNE